MADPASVKAATASVGVGAADFWPRLRRRLAPWAPVLVLIALCVAISLVNGRFVSLRNFARIADAASIPLVLGLGVTFIILMGSIDLSMEGVVAFGAVILCLLVANGANANDLGLLGAVAVLGVGALMGLANGVIHVGLRIPSFMVTLGMWFVGIGIGNTILGGIQVRITDETIRALALDQLLGLKYQVWLALLALLVAWIVQERTRLGRYIFAIGGGEDLAALSGIPTRLVRILTFTMAGVFYALGGIMAAAQQGSAFALIGSGRLFTAITAVVVGGTALWGGQGGVLNTLVGVLIVVVLANGMVLMGVSPFIQQIVQGLLIIVAVALSVDRKRATLVK